MSKYSATKLLRRSITTRIRILRSLDLLAIDDAALERQIRGLLERPGFVSRPMWIEKRTFFRVRATPTNFAFDNVSDLWWPNKKYVKQRGRCNEVENPIFYCADSDHTAIIEMRPDVGDMLTVLEVSLKDGAAKPLVMSVGIHEFTAKSNPRYGGTPPERDTAQQLFLRREGISTTNPILNEYLTREFMREVTDGNEHEYKITSAIARILLAQEEFFNEDGTPAPRQVIHGIAYPSIRSDKLGANFAFTTEAADELFKPAFATLCRVEEKRDSNHYCVGVVMQSQSIEADGKIEWEIPKPAEVRLTSK